jgi:hypothetical protein
MKSFPSICKRKSHLGFATLFVHLLSNLNKPSAFKVGTAGVLGGDLANAGDGAITVRSISTDVIGGAFYVSAFRHFA